MRGYTNRGEHRFARIISRALRFLKAVQDPEGCFGPRSDLRFIYNHAAASQAMIEAYGMTGSPIYKGPAQRSLGFLQHARNPDGGWRYGVQSGENDTSVTAMCFAPMAAVHDINRHAAARGKPQPLEAEDVEADVRRWLDRVTDPDTGRTGYDRRG